MKKTILTVLLICALTIPVVAQDNTPVVPDYSNSPRSEVPEEFTWNIADIYENQAAWKADFDKVASVLDDIDAIAETWTDSAADMLAFFKRQEEIGIVGARLFQYAGHQYNADMQNPKYQIMLGQLQFVYSKIAAKTSFVQSDILALGKETFEQYVKEEPDLENYAFGIRDIFRQKDHILPADQQKIVSMMSSFVGAPNQASSMLNNLNMPNPKVILSDGKEYTLNYPTYARLREQPLQADRQKVMDTFFANVLQFDDTFAVLLDAEMKKHLFQAQVQGYEDTLKARMDADNIDTTVYHTNIKMVRENLDALHRYLKLKKKLLGLENFKYCDIYAGAVKAVNKIYSWEEAEGIIKSSLAPLGPKYLEGIDKAFGERWIDRYPNKGKQSGAYSSGVYGVHPFIKMNYTGNFNNVSTLTHELGHAMHSYFSQKAQSYSNTSYSTFLAEMASTFNEHLLIDYLIANETDDLLKLFILDNYIEGMRGTIYRQTLFAEFELAMHRHVESGNTLTADWLNNKYLALTREYYGHDKGVVQVDDFIKCEWAVIHHFFMNYYVSNYSTGMISSMALLNIVKNEGEPGVKKYINEFLSAGGSDYSLNILKRTGVDMTTEKPFVAAFERLNKVIDEMEAIIKRLETEGKLSE